MHKEQLYYFTLAYQTRNYSAAAKRVPMSPQGFAKSIHSLEKELGVELFTDENGALNPTPYANELLKYANIWSVNYELMKESFRRIEAQERHEIRLGTSLGIIGYLGTKFLSGFHKQHPEITVSYNETNDAYCEEGLRQGLYDLAFTLSPYEPDFFTTKLYSTQTYFWVNSSQKVSGKEALSIEDFHEAAIGMPGKDFKIYHKVLSACEAAEIEPSQVYTSSEIFWLYEMATKNQAMTFTLPHLIELSVFSQIEKTKALPLEGMIWSFGISHLTSHSPSPHEQTFIDYCIDYTRDLQ